MTKENEISPNLFESDRDVKQQEIDINFDLIIENPELKQISIKRDTFLKLFKLMEQNNELSKSNEKLTQNLKTIKDELGTIKLEQDQEISLRKAPAKRKFLPKREPITPEIYQLLLNSASKPGYKWVRTRLALCLLVLTGIRINQLLALKVYQLDTLLKSFWISIDCVKDGSANHKAFLSDEGKKLIEERRKDFEFILLIKNPDSYIFTAESTPDKMLRRETLTRDINNLMRSVSNSMPTQPNISSRSFRIGYISKLWKDTKDIEFVRQSLYISTSYIER